MRWTCYIDEAGQFSAREGSQVKLGLRVVGGLLLRGDRSEHDALAADLHRTHLGWAAAEPHCADFNAFAIGHRLRNLPKAAVPVHLSRAWEAVRTIRPNVLRARSPAAYFALSHEGQRLYRAIRAATGELANRFAGRILLSAEHDTEPTPNRYPAMLEAVVELALATVADRREPTQVAFVIEHRSDQPADLSDRLRARALNFPGSRIGVEVTSVEVVGKSVSAALAGADTVTYAIGPGPKHSVPVSVAEARSKSLVAVKNESLQLFKTNAVLATDSIWAHREWVLALERGELTAALDARLRGALAELPRGCLAFGVQGTQAAAAAFSRQQEEAS